MRATTKPKNRTLIIVIVALALAAAGFTIGMMAKSTMASSDKEIGIEKAKEIALSSVGVTAEKATFTKATMDVDDHQYEIDFYTNDYEYDFEIDAATGDILEKEIEKHVVPEANTTQDVPSAEPDTIQQSSDSSVIGVEAAKKIALQYLGLSTAKFHEVKLDSDDGTRIYEIELTSNHAHYDFEINAYTGEILEFDQSDDDFYDDRDYNEHDDD